MTCKTVKAEDGGYRSFGNRRKASKRLLSGVYRSEVTPICGQDLIGVVTI